jgi:Zn-dependent protease with chaperone function
MKSGRTRVVLLFLSLLLFIRSVFLVAGPHPESNANLDRINTIVSELRNRLEMPQAIQAAIVAENDLMISVEHVSAKAEDAGTFIMCFDEHFLARLDEEELKAAIAHELGHVWIFSHHPYLQTEALANQIAMRVVSRQSLIKVYSKLWAHLGVSRNLDELLGADAGSNM